MGFNFSEEVMGIYRTISDLSPDGRKQLFMLLAIDFKPPRQKELVHLWDDDLMKQYMPFMINHTNIISLHKNEKQDMALRDIIKTLKYYNPTWRTFTDKNLSDTRIDTTIMDFLMYEPTADSTRRSRVPDMNRPTEKHIKKLDEHTYTCTLALVKCIIRHMPF